MGGRLNKLVALKSAPFRFKIFLDRKKLWVSLVGHDTHVTRGRMRSVVASCSTV
jgi:hypothetical protein